MKLRVGSRGSALALAQTKTIVDAIERSHPEINVEIVAITTTGDKILHKTLDKIGGKGLFIKELEEALLEKKVDITVHSLKDMPIEISEKLPILAISPRENPYDVLVLPQGESAIDFSKPIGTASQRRAVQIQEIFPECTVSPVRGNVMTRLEKLDDGQFSAVILAYAGLKRLGLEHRISRVFSREEMLPSGCQGILAIQGRDGENNDFLQELHCKKSEIISKSERAFLGMVDGGCSSPIGTFGEITNDILTLHGMILDKNSKIVKASVEMPMEHIDSIATKLYQKINKLQ